MEWIPAITNLGIGATMAALFVVLVQRIIPTMLAAFRAEMAEERLQCDRRMIRLEVLQERLEKSQHTFGEHLKDMLKLKESNK